MVLRAANRRFLGVVAIGLVGAFAAPAWAQEGAAAAGPRVVLPKDASVYVLQERAYTKRGRFELTPLFFTALNPKFVGYAGAALAGAYHIRENFAVTVTTSVPGMVHSYFSSLTQDVHVKHNLKPDAVDLKHMRYLASAGMELSALYGKFRFDLIKRQFLVDFDAYLGAGMGMAKTLTTCKVNEAGCSDVVGIDVGLRPPDDVNDHWKVTGNLALGVRLFISDMFGMRVELRDLVYSDRGFDREKQAWTTDIRNQMLIFVGLSTLI